MSGLSVESIVDSIIQSASVAAMYKILFTKQRSFAQIFSMDTLREGGKLSVATISYNVVGRPVVKMTQNAIQGVVNKVA